jgi:pyruvate formate lyase activating enzyme
MGIKGFRPFCHNPPLVLEPDTFPDLDPADLLADLADRKTFIDGIVVSGGEPTLDRNLPSFLKEVKALGLAVKLDTNGLAPQVIAELLAGELVDYLAIDLKTTLERYPELHPGPVSPEKLVETIRLCAGAQIELEYRTTCVPDWVDADVIAELGALIDGAPLWALQQYHPEHALCEKAQDTTPYAPGQVQSFVDLASRYAQRVILRGV